VTIARPPRGPDIATDRELWTRAAAGDRAAFGELFERHAEAVWNHAYRLTASWSQAEDLTSSTFLLAWRTCGEVRLVRDSALAVPPSDTPLTEVRLLDHEGTLLWEGPLA
jgi:hypothetical protein